MTQNPLTNASPSSAMAVPNQPALSTPVPGVARSRRNLLWRLVDRISVYLPIFLMGLLAAGSYWLLRSTPEPELPKEAMPVSHDADLIMKGFSVKTFDGVGRQESEVFGIEARHFPDTKELEITDARVRTFSPTGQLTSAKADLITANDEGTRYTLKGNGEVIQQAGRDAEGRRTPRMEFHGDYLLVTTRPERVFSDQPVLVIRGRDKMQADSLRYWGDQRRVIQMGGNVKMAIQPAGKDR